MTRRGFIARRVAAFAATSSVLTALACQMVLDLGQYELRDGEAGAGGNAGALSEGAAGAAGPAPSEAVAAGTGGTLGGAAGSASGGSSELGVDTRLADAGELDAAVAPDAGPAPGGCGSDADCAGSGECVEAVCAASGQCEQRPRELGFPCGDGLDAACTRPDACDGAGLCQPNHVSAGAPVSPPDGDCLVIECDGQGQTRTAPDNDDVPIDPGTGCMQPACLAGAPVAVARGRGTLCEFGRCDGSGNCQQCLDGSDCPQQLPFCSAGACVECTDASQCPAPGRQCAVAACDGNRCGSAPAPLPTPCDDGFFCTVNDTCSAGGFCVGQQQQCPTFTPHCSEELLRCVECTSDDQCQFSCDDFGTCRS